MHATNTESSPVAAQENAPYPSQDANIRHDWKVKEVKALFALPLNDLVFKAQSLHREYFEPNQVQLSTLINIKTGACPEDCGYCPQSVRFNTDLEVEPLMALETVREAAKVAKAHGAGRFCMGAAWRRPKGKDFEQVINMVKAVREEGLETCVTLGMLTDEQAEQLSDAGLDYYNHNLDTSEAYYSKIITTRQYRDRLETLSNVRDAGLKVCAGGIIGMGEQLKDRAALLATLANLREHPESVPINQLVKVEGTPLENVEDIDVFDMVRCIGVARIMMPASYVRLSAGREQMSDELQALCFLAGANSMFYGEKLLTTGNPDVSHDRTLFKRLGLTAEHIAV
jgi:biotin synthase